MSGAPRLVRLAWSGKGLALWVSSSSGVSRLGRPAEQLRLEPVAPWRAHSAGRSSAMKLHENLLDRL